jgi:UDP-N-acetylmuramoyl-L-alanyl-D-glutamate--2,6-diaminopimelate ligase
MENVILPTIWPVACHTDNVGQGTIFVAIKGHNLDGLQFILLALQKGASQIVADQAVSSPELAKLVESFGAKLTLVANTRAALSSLSAKAWGYPAQKIKIIGVTGTKGKTTTVYALRHILATSGKQVAMLTGVENMIGNQKFVSSLTTPHPDYLHMFLAQCVQGKIEYVVMEASAQALSLNRLDDLLFAGVVFTNLELEHSEFYSDIQAYFLAKCKLFNFLINSGFIVLNLDDTWAQKLINQKLVPNVIGFGQQNLVNFNNFVSLGLINVDLANGLDFNLSFASQTNFNYNNKQVFGLFNAYNLTCAILCARQLAISDSQVQQAVASFLSAPGRLEIYKLPNGAWGVVDYAHTPGSFKSILTLLRSQTHQLIIVFGAGGGRDPIKRPLMGQIASQLGDMVILTNDNPRQEDPSNIIKQIIGTCKANNILVEQDRARAIKLAYSLSTPGAIIVLLGKGPDEYQIIGHQKTFFSDREQLKSLTPN